jgi:hypothetical protein
VKTVYDIYHWRHPDACAELTRGYDTPEQAADALFAIAGVPRTAEWVRVRADNGWIIDPDPVTGRQTEWGVFEREEAETDAERVQLALGMAFEYGQTGDDHHKAWVIDQIVRILAGDSYADQVAEHCDGIDGPETYTWDEGIAP